MPFDPTVTHPLYDEFAPSWQLMRDAVAGEDTIKAAGEKYLPLKSGIAAMADGALKRAAYEAYKLRAEFPELAAPTVRGAIGTMLAKPVVVELPKGMEPLRERATRDGLTLDALHRRIATEVLTVGRYGILPGLAADGTPYLAGYVAESIINWDASDGEPDFVMLNEAGWERDRETGKWSQKEQYRECVVEDGRYVSRVWVKTKDGWIVSDEVEAADRKRRPLDFLPFVFVGCNDLSADPDDVPLYGLAKLSVRIYRLDADYTFALHMTSEPTPVAIGFDDPRRAIENGEAPTTLGSSRLWLLPKGGDAKYLEFSGPGLDKQAAAIRDALERSSVFGAQLLAETGRTAESGEAKKVRLGNQTATLKTIAMSSAAALERALRHLAIWIGEDPEEVKVTPNTDFFDHTLSAQEIGAIVDGWTKGAYSWRTAFERLQKGGLIDGERTPEEELDLMDQDEVGRDQQMAALLPRTTDDGGDEPAVPA